MTIEAQAKFAGIIPVWKKREVKPGTTLRWRIGGLQWGIEKEYFALDEDSLVDRREEAGLAVDPEDAEARRVDAKSSTQTILFQDDINKAEIAIPLPFVRSIVRVVSWKSSRIKR